MITATSNPPRDYREGIEPFLKWVGSKRRVLPTLEEAGLIPDAFLEDHSRALVVPFMGSGSALFRYGYVNGHSRPMYVQDLNFELVNAMRVVADNMGELAWELDLLQSQDSEATYYAVRSWDRDPTWNPTSAARAARFIYINRTGFNGLWRVNKKGYCNTPWGKRPFTYDYGHLRDASDYLHYAEIALMHSGNFESCCALADKGDLIFADPPYVPKDGAESSFTAYTSQGFDKAQTLLLLDAAESARARGADMLITNHAPEWLVKEARSRDLHVTEYEAMRSVGRTTSSRGKCPEIAITTYAPQL
jgi:DNA adenine methylase